MNVQIKESNEPLTDEDLQDVEKTLEATLPLGYRSFLLRYNGGYPDVDVFRLPNGSREMVDRFLGIHNGEHDNLMTYCKIYRNRLPLDLIPVAHDAGGNLICVSVKGERRGRVLFWDHEEEAEEDGADREQNVYPVANSFDAFLAMLTSLENA